MEKYLEILKTCPLFWGMNGKEIQSAVEFYASKPCVAEKNQYILRAGDRTDSIGLIFSGGALVIQEDLWGNRNIMTRLVPGDLFAEPFAVIPDAILSVSVVATAKCEFTQIDASRLLTAGDRRLTQNLIMAFSKKLLMFNDKITHMSHRKTRDKLLSYLSSEAIRQGSLSFDISYNRQQLADFLCVERAAMSAELSKLQNEGYLKTERSHFELNTMVGVI